ncbi:MAG TPA: 50S ribosomal protein L5 [Planctomycetota bacterium]|nr:50S ribosomal protein L5 [Planctomycetota bacterium]
MSPDDKSDKAEAKAKAKADKAERHEKAEAAAAKAAAKAERAEKGEKAEKAPKEKAAPSAPPPEPRLRLRFRDEIRPALMQAHGEDNVNAAPRLRKIVLNMGVGAARENKALIDAAAADLTMITGQKAAQRKARKAVSNFHLREGMPIGCVVTLRGARMWEFLDRLITVVVPRIKDFRGLPRGGFDGRGNYNMGLPDQTVFPEMELDKIKHFQGMNITIVTTAGQDAVGLDLLERLGMPFRSTAAEKEAQERKKRA